MNQSRIGLIGIGLVGTAIVERLLAAEWPVLGFDIDAARCDALVKLGGKAATSADEVARGCETILVSLPTSGDVLATLDSCRAAIRADQLWIDMTTGEPDDARMAWSLLRESQAAFVEATILGSSEEVRRGSVVVMLGGDEAAVVQAQSYVRAFAAQTFHVGKSGSAAEMKLVANLVLGLNRAALAEGMAFARGLGINMEQALEVLRSGAAYSRVMDTKGPKILACDFAPQARLAQHHKDVGLIRAAAARHGVPTPLSDVHEQMLAAAITAGDGSLDNSAIFRFYDRSSPFKFSEASE